MLNKLSASRQSQLIRNREVSATELLNTHLQEIEECNPEVNAFITLDENGARQSADRLDRMAANGEFAGPLHGLTVGIKDMAPVAGMRCTYGSMAFADNVAELDAAHQRNGPGMAEDRPLCGYRCYWAYGQKNRRSGFAV